MDGGTLELVSKLDRMMQIIYRPFFLNVCDLSLFAFSESSSFFLLVPPSSSVESSMMLGGGLFLILTIPFFFGSKGGQIPSLCMF